MLAKMAELANASRNDDGSTGVSTTSNHAAVTSTGAGGTSTSAGDVPGDANKTNDKDSDNTSDRTSTGFYDDIPSFNLFNNGELDQSYVAVDSTPPAATNIEGTTFNHETDVNKPGSSTHDKKNRRKRAAINLNQGKKPKKLKVDEESRLAYKNYLSKRILKKVPADQN